MAKTAKLPSEHFKEVVDVLRLCSGLIGLDILDPHYRKNFLTACVFFWVCAYPICVVSTILQEFENNWKIALEALCMFITVFQGATKFFCALGKQKVISSTYFMLFDIYQEYEKHGQEYCDALMEGYIRVRKAMRIMLMTGLLPGIGILAMPFIMLLLDRSNRYLMMPVLFPYIDVNTTSGYYTTLGIQGTIMFIGSFGIFAADLLVLIYFMQCYIYADILRLKIKNLNILLHDSGEKSIIMEELMNIVKWHESFSCFTDTCNDCFYWIIMACVGTSGIGIVLTLFMLVTTDWPGAYPYLVVGFYTLYTYCILGTKIEICNEKFIEVIYEINWYNMQPRQQKIFLIMLMRSQNPKTIEIAGILPLSVTTALRISKTIYSIFMMMLQFLVE